MRILHLSNSDSSGAGLCAYRINKSLQKSGVDSKMLVLKKSSNDDSVRSTFIIKNTIYRIFHFMLRFFRLYFFEYDRLIKLSEEYGVGYSRPITPFDLSNHPWVKEADIIHFHWVDDFFDQKKFLEKVKKPIVWTLHDENLFYGISHYHDKVLADERMEIKYKSIKEQMIKNCPNLIFVFLSEYFAKNFGSNDIIKGHKYTVINNSVDTDDFILINKDEAKSRLKLLSKFIYFAFLAGNISDEQKGLHKLIKAVNKLNEESDRFRIIAIGNNPPKIYSQYMIETGPIYDCNILSEWLSASDYFIMPSSQEAFSQAPIEAMACGTPVVAFPVSGTSELINYANGVICKGFAIEDLLQGIMLALSRSYNSKEIRSFVSLFFSPSHISEQYKNLYYEILTKSNNND